MSESTAILTGETSEGKSKSYVSLICKITVVLVVFLVTLKVGVFVNKWYCSHVSDVLHEAAPVVETGCGRIEGKLVNTRQARAYVFKGIPYARPPINQLRWDPPLSAACGKQTFKAFEFGNICSQLDLVTLKIESGTEDCLFLNVWTPSLYKSAKLPVMVWIHGGNLVAGSGNLQGMEKFVYSMGIVMVSFNYRLNAFGFLALDALSQSSKTNTSGNYGFMDQIMALKWVRMNIDKFGGDPQSVTVVGHSSGATSIYGLLASKKAAGLFIGAIAMSGSPVFSKTTKEASQDNLVFLTNCKCNKTTTKETLRCLHGLSQSQILQSIPWFTYPSWAMRDLNNLITKDKFVGALCVVDGDVVLTPPGKLYTMPPLGQKIPVLIGSTAQETDFVPSEWDFQNKTFSDLVKFIEQRLGAFSGALPRKAIATYEKIMKSKIAQLYYTTITSDIRVNCPQNILSNNLSKVMNLDVYRYEVTNRPSKKLATYGNHTTVYSVHGWDEDALFGFYNMPPSYKPSARDWRFAQTIRKEFLHFMIYGKPAKADWNMYPRKIGIFENEQLAVKDSYHKEQCDLWNEYNLFPYGWVN